MAGDPEFKGSREEWMSEHGFERLVMDEFAGYRLVRRGDGPIFSIEDATWPGDFRVVGSFGPAYDGTNRFRAYGRDPMKSELFEHPFDAFRWWVGERA